MGAGSLPRALRYSRYCSVLTKVFDSCIGTADRARMSRVCKEIVLETLYILSRTTRVCQMLARAGHSTLTPGQLFIDG